MKKEPNQWGVPQTQGHSTTELHPQPLVFFETVQLSCQGGNWTWNPVASASQRHLDYR